MEYKEIIKKADSELHGLLAQTRDRLRELRFKDAGKQLKNVREIRVLRKTVAGILTFLNKKKDTK